MAYAQQASPTVIIYLYYDRCFHMCPPPSKLTNAFIPHKTYKLMPTVCRTAVASWFISYTICLSDPTRWVLYLPRLIYVDLQNC